MPTPAILSFVVVLLFSGCTLIEHTVEVPFRGIKAVLPGGGETEPVDPIDLQEDMLRFADNFVISISKAGERLARDGKPIERAELLKIKIALASDVYGLATGSNALANLVGLTVLASGARWRVQDYWLPKVYGVSAEPMLQTLEDREQEIWAIANRVLKPEMQAELRDAVAKWRKTSGSPAGDLEAFASNSLVNEVTRNSQAARAASLPSSVFALLDLDPLAGLDPATRELTETRLFAERALFVGQRMPQLIQWQMEMLAMHATSSPKVDELISGTSQIASAGNRLTQTLEQIPGLITTERENLAKALKSEKGGLLELSQNVGQTLNAGWRMADSTENVMKTYQGLMTYLDQRPHDPGEKPFDITEYGTSAREINLMSVQLAEMLKELQRTLDPARTSLLSSQVDTLTRETEARSRAVIDYAFDRALLFVALATGIFFVSGLLYQWISRILRKATPA